MMHVCMTGRGFFFLSSLLCALRNGDDTDAAGMSWTQKLRRAP